MRRRDEVAVGILITIAIAVLAAGALWLARGGLSRGYPLYTRFQWGQSLKQGQPVLLAGVNIGYVSDVKLRRDGFLDVTFRVNGDQTVPKGSVASVKPVGIFGDVAVALTPTLPVPLQNYASGDTVPAGTPGPDIAQIMTRVDSIGLNVERMTRALDMELVQAGGVKDLRRTIAATTSLASQLQAIAAEQNHNITATLAAYRRAATAIDSARIDSTLRSFSATSQNFAKLATSLDSASRQLNNALAKLNTGEGSAGRLLTDDSLYRDIRHVVGSVDSLMNDFKKNPRKYINLRIF
ncbi:MAG TPA: MlaD family protein [Gemmatimonadaceae bacterium]|nr:MlaD family protein [Gemmatimonadaceae bacterium]